MSREIDPFTMPRLLNIIDGDTIRAFEDEIGITGQKDIATGKILIELQLPDYDSPVMESFPPAIAEIYDACFYNPDVDIDDVEYVFVAASDATPGMLELDIQSSQSAVRRRYTASQEKLEKTIFTEPSREYILPNTHKKPWM